MDKNCIGVWAAEVLTLLRMIAFIYSGHIMDKKSHEPSLASRRNFMGAVAAAAGGLAVGGGGLASTPAQAQQASAGAKKGMAVALNWKEVYFTNCPMVSANNVDQELGWCREEYKKIGVEYAYFRHAPENNWYPHYIHNLDNLIRFGGLYPPIHVHADIRRTVLMGATWVHEGGCMAVRADDKIFKSVSPDWMVINGAKGIFTASGTINGSGEYIILVSVIDGNIAGGPDRIHVMIWNEMTGDVVYDNSPVLAELADPTQPVDGGSIVVHKAK